jgi:hypothetical protein
MPLDHCSMLPRYSAETDEDDRLFVRGWFHIKTELEGGISVREAVWPDYEDNATVTAGRAAGVGGPAKERTLA